MTNDAPTEAACGAPNSAGSASGLRNSPCNAAPAKPNVPPIKIASSVRGSRISRTTIPAAPSPLNSPAIASRGDRPAGPTISEMTASTTISAASARLSRRPLGPAPVIISPPAPFLQASGLPSNGIAALSSAQEERCIRI